MLLLGIIGCIVPIIPGTPLSYVGILLLHFTERYQFSTNFLIFWGILTVLAYVLDYIIPAMGTKKYGGSKRGVWGSMIGLLLGIIFFPPFGIIIGPFIGAVVGELTTGRDMNKALKAGKGSFIGLLIGTAIKLIVSGMMTFYAFKEILQSWI